MRGRWTDGGSDVLRSAVTGTLRSRGVADPAAGEITFWPRRVRGTIIGPRRIALDVDSDQGHLVVDGEVGPPFYPLGITLPGRIGADGVDQDVKVWIDPIQLVALWLGFSPLG